MTPYRPTPASAPRASFPRLLGALVRGLPLRLRARRRRRRLAEMRRLLGAMLEGARGRELLAEYFRRP